jgi:uncharacterized protein (TIGR00730 family)
MSKRVAVFGSSSITQDSQAGHEAYALGRLLGEQGFVVVNGGYGGVMEAVSKGCKDSGGDVLGVTCKTFTFRSGGNPYLTWEYPASNISVRLGKLLEFSDLVIAMPGNVGTVNEIFFLLTCWKVKEHAHPLILWREPFEEPLRLFAKRGLIEQCDFDSFLFVDSAEEALSAVKGISNRH